MSIIDDLNLGGFLETLTYKTKEQTVSWTKVNPVFYNKLIDSAQTHSEIKNAFYTENGKGNTIVIGKAEKKVYYEEDEYYFEDSFFITFTNPKFEDPTTFLDNEQDKSMLHSLPFLLSKLHRLIQINERNIKGKIDNWFD